jgi:septation ring formation regulator EzrA
MHETITVMWMDACRQIVTLEVLSHVAERIEAGEQVTYYSSAEPRRQSVDDALDEIRDQQASIRAQLDQINAERDALVTEYPE